ncbi:MAG: GNAT family N-acetyltransferase [Opitutales bacterium]|jgi:ribosomal protein S18 acetylase RimI-like enzyme|nr:GNAT family N-acetyltransferase [Opitutales bacterium]MDB2499530.1 GNAT family N-acetyltransferase [bacterium]MDG2167221.1 GNAT family N-acetyltransferase [Opitutales bacterium]
MKFSIRPMRGADLLDAMRLKDAEGWNQTLADWAFYLEHDPELCLVAEVDDQVVGTVMAINYNNEVAWIGMMIVDKSYRKYGVSTALLNEVIARLKDCQSIKLDASPAGSHVYEKLGFVVELELQRMIAASLSASVDVLANDFIQRIRESDIQHLIEFDSQAFGASRIGLIHHLAGSRLDIGWIARSQGEVNGFLLIREGTLYHQVGPLFAQSEALACELFSLAAKHLEGKPVTVDIHTSKVEFRDFLLSLGFETQRPFYRMYLNKNPFPGLPDSQFTLASPEVG